MRCAVALAFFVIAANAQHPARDADDPADHDPDNEDEEGSGDMVSGSENEDPEVECSTSRRCINGAFCDAAKLSCSPCSVCIISDIAAVEGDCLKACDRSLKRALEKSPHVANIYALYLKTVTAARTNGNFDMVKQIRKDLDFAVAAWKASRSATTTTVSLHDVNVEEGNSSTTLALTIVFIVTVFGLVLYRKKIIHECRLRGGFSGSKDIAHLGDGFLRNHTYRHSRTDSDDDDDENIIVRHRSRMKTELNDASWDYSGSDTYALQSIPGTAGIRKSDGALGAWRESDDKWSIAEMAC